MFRTALSGAALAFVLACAGGASAQGTPPLPSMPHPPSFDDPAPAAAKAKKPVKKSGKAASAGTSSGASSFERPNKFVPAEFDREGGGGSSGPRAAPMMSSSGRPGMGMRF